MRAADRLAALGELEIASARRLLCVAFACLWLWPLPAAAQANRPPMGMFALWAKDASGADLGGREATLRRWEAQLRLAPSSLLAMDFYGEKDWRSLGESAWLPAYWRARNPNRKLIWSLPLTFAGTTLKSVAAGDHDADFARAAAAIAASNPDAILRIGWEMNGDWFPWASKGVESDYVAAYRRVAKLLKAASPRFSFVWCVNVGLQNSRPDLAYPGDDVVDAIGMDVYDAPFEPDVVKRWRDTVVNGPFGLTWLADFAARRHKKISIPEWGVGLHDAPDDPYFVERMAAWMAAHADAIAFEAYFNAPPHVLDSGRFPQSLAAFLRRFSARRDPQRRSGGAS